MKLPFLKKKREPLPDTEKLFETEEITAKDIIAPSSITVTQDSIRLGNRYAKTFFIFSFPRYLGTSWLSSVINLNVVMDISMFIHPIETGFILKKLRRRVTEVQSELLDEEAKGLVRNPELETAFQDLEALRDRLQTAQEKMFRFALYITIYGPGLEQLREIETTLRSIFEARLLYVKPALYQQKEGFHSCLPYGTDVLQIHTPMNTAPLSAVFPFVSFDLSSNQGIMYGINRHNNSMILFDRFSLENANAVIFAKSGSGKSVIGSEPVLVKNKHRIQLVKIGDLIEKLIKKHGATQIDEELEGVIDPELKVYSFNKNLKSEWSKVTVAARKKAPDMFYRFTTSSGREITTTGDHNMLVLRNGKVVAARSSDVTRGEFAPVPRFTSNDQAHGLQALNLLEVLKDYQRVHVAGGQEIIRENYDTLRRTSLDPRFDRYLSKYRHGRRIPLNYFRKILGVLHMSPANVSSETVKVISPNGHKKSAFPLHMPVTSELLKVMGYIAAEGTVRKNVAMISNLDSEVLQDLDDALTSLHVPFYYGNKGIVIACPLFVKILHELGCQGRSGKKRVSPLVFAQTSEKQAAFLASYFEGDGGIERPATISATSKSRALISEISYLLLSFGIIGRISRVSKRATNRSWRRKRIYYKLTISGQDNLRKFHSSINFITARKRKSLSEIISRDGNTNVDIIPGLEPIFQDIDRLFGFQLHGIQDISPLKRNVYNPSPEKLKEVIAKIEERVRRFKDLAPTFQMLRELPELAAIIDMGRNNKKVNRALWQTLGHSWWTAKHEHRQPFFQNALKMIEVVTGESYDLHDIKDSIYSGFQEMDLLVKHYNPSLQSALVARPQSNTSYKLVQEAAHHVWQNYRDILENNIPKVEERLEQLKLLCASDLFWDPIEKIEKIENKKEKYVYDLTVDNEVFLAGQGGMFVHNSYAVKLQILRHLMWGVDVFVLDPENEYKTLAEAAGGSFFSISLGSNAHINPFDLPQPRKDERAEDVLRSNVINLVGLMRIGLGGLTPEEDAIMDRAITETYAAKDITPASSPETWQGKIPLMEDLEAVLETMDGTDSLVKRMRKFTKGTYSNFFNQPTNISLDKNIVTFGIREMEDALRPMAIYIIMRHIWNAVRSELKKRIFVLDEAWWIMQTEDGASFLFGMAKRARKYWLGVTTITQDVDDFMRSQYGKPIITNSSIQLLMKQSPASIDVVQKAFNLTLEEKNLLLETEVGEGIFFAGEKHVAIKVVASPVEHALITTSPEEIAKQNAREEDRLSEEAGAELPTTEY